MRRLALTIALFGFLVLAGIALACGVPTFDAAMRALAAAAALYVVVSFAGKTALNIMVDAVVSSAPKPGPDKDAQP